MTFELAGSRLMRAFTEGYERAASLLALNRTAKLKASAGPHVCRGIASEPRRDCLQPQRICTNLSGNRNDAPGRLRGLLSKPLSVPEILTAVHVCQSFQFHLLLAAE